MASLDEWPPLYISVSSYLGIKPKEQVLGIDEFITMMSGGDLFKMV
jgi:hypothetical protein